MCLAVPVKVVEIVDSREGIVEWKDMTMSVGIELVPEVRVGDWVLVHTGYAIQILDPEEAAKSLELFKEILEYEPSH